MLPVYNVLITIMHVGYMFFWVYSEDNYLTINSIQLHDVLMEVEVLCIPAQRETTFTNASTKSCNCLQG